MIETMTMEERTMTQAPPPRRWVGILGWIALLSLIGAQIFGFVKSPPDRDMGNLEKILYVHVPAAWNMSLAFTFVFGMSIAYLWRRSERLDLLAAAGAEAGTVLTGLTLMLGSIWARPTWGVWWTWDPRLTTTAILFVIYVGYLALRAFTEDPEQRARWSAAVGVLGFLNVLIVYKSVQWWRTIHQVQSTPSTVAPAYAWSLRLNAIAILLILIYFVAKRYQIALAERALETRLEETALARREVHV